MSVFKHYIRSLYSLEPYEQALFDPTSVSKKYALVALFSGFFFFTLLGSSIALYGDTDQWMNVIFGIPLNTISLVPITIFYSIWPQTWPFFASVAGMAILGTLILKYKIDARAMLRLFIVMLGALQLVYYIYLHIPFTHHITGYSMAGCRNNVLCHTLMYPFRETWLIGVVLGTGILVALYFKRRG